MIAIAISIIVELILMVLVYIKIGGERFPVQFGRLLFQFVFIGLIVSSESKIGLFILTGYHIVTAIFILNSPGKTDTYILSMAFYHIVIAFAIYFHDWLEKLSAKS